MRLTDRYDGSGDPFEGERTIAWRSLPASAMVTKATVTIAPRMAPGTRQYIETLRFGAGGPTFGATIRQAVTAVAGTADGVVEIDFHARRTAIGFSGIAVAAASALSVDIGAGIFLAVGKDGAIPAALGSVFPFSTGNLPGLTAQRLRLDNATLPNDPTGTRIDIASMPSNVTLRFGKQPPFFARNGELARSTTTPDITAALQRALADATVTAGYYMLPLVVHSDTLGRLEITLDVEYLGTASLLPPGLREVVLPYDLSSVTTTDPSALSAMLPAGAAIVATQTSLQVRGAFEASRVAQGPTGVTVEGPALSCSSGRTLAQKLVPAAGIQLTGVDLFLVAEGPAARLALDIRPDADGKPGQQSLLAKAAPFDLAGNASGRKAWIGVPVAPAALLAAGTPVWIVVQAIDGSALLGLDATAANEPAGMLQHSADAGFSWRRAGPAGKLLWRLRQSPTRFEMPIDFVAGAGAAAQRVSLAAYDAAGKIDAVIDRPEIAVAIQGALEAMAEAPCAALQLLANPDFAKWTVAGKALGASDTITLPSKNWANVIDTFFDRIIANPAVDLDEPDALAFTNDGAILYALAQETVTGFDTIRFEATTVATVTNAVALAAAPRGRLLYVAGASELTAIELATGNTNVVDASFTGAKGLVLAPDGGVAFVNDPDGGNIVACDLRTGLVTWRATVTATAVALSADGATLAAADAGRKRLVGLVAATGQIVWSVSLPDGRQPVGIAAAAPGDGFYAVGAGEVDLALVVIALNGRPGQSMTLPIGHAAGQTLALLARPQGDRIYVGPVALALDPGGGRLAAGGISDTGTTIAAIAVGNRQPIGWSVTAGSTIPIDGGSSERIAAALVPDGAPEAALSQVIAVSPNCFHELSVTARLIAGFQRVFGTTVGTPEAVAELFWLNAAGALLRTDTLALPPSRLVSTQSLTVTPPPASAQAELRIRVAGGACILSHVTLQMTDATLRRDGWRPDLSSPAAIVASDGADGTIYRNPGSTMGALAQQVSLPAAGGWALELEASAAANAAGETPAIEIGFLDAAATPLGPKKSFSAAALGFAAMPALLDAPARAVVADVRMILPAATSLQVRRLQLRPRPAAPVPCGFIAQSPGSLHVSNARVVYDMVLGTAPAPPAGGFARPTRPPANPGDPTCADDAREVAAAPAVPPAVRPAVMRAPTPAPSLPPAVPLTEVAGIGVVRARRLHAAGIVSATELAAASPETVLAALGNAVGVTPALAATLIERAKAAPAGGAG